MPNSVQQTQTQFVETTVPQAVCNRCGSHDVENAEFSALKVSCGECDHTGVPDVSYMKPQ